MCVFWSLGIELEYGVGVWSCSMRLEYGARVWNWSMELMINSVGEWLVIFGRIYLCKRD